MFDRYKNGYNRCKVKDKEVYDQLLTLYKPYITPEALKMIAHPFSTQTNEAMNKSVSAFVPKGKMFSWTESLDTRVGIAAKIWESSLDVSLNIQEDPKNHQSTSFYETDTISSLTRGWFVEHSE